MKFQDKQLKTWAEEFNTYRDVIDTPGWRMIEGLIMAQREWYKAEMERVIKDRTVPVPEGGQRRLMVQEILEEVSRLQCHMEEDEFLLDMILNKIALGSASCKILERRMGLKTEIKPPSFQEIR